MPTATLALKPVRPATAAESAMLQERARIARELHDSVSQTLYAIILTAKRGMSLLEQNQTKDMQPIINDVLHLADVGQCELRALLTDIRSDRLVSAGLVAALTHLAADVQRRNELHIRLSLAHEPDLPAATKNALVLIAREALHNVVQHASADRADIALGALGADVELVIADNGRGFDPAVFRPGHLGLQSMRERAEGIGATLDVFSADGAGTQVRVRIPGGMRRNE
jgi:signal transduction histidine kinase